MKKPKKTKPKQKVIKKYAVVDEYGYVCSEFFPDLQSCKEWISNGEIYIYELNLVRKYYKSDVPTYVEVPVE